SSRSLQGASSLNPRAILFGKDGKLTCTFNGSDAQRGYDSLECIQFRENERAFDFRQIQFPTTQNGLKEVQFSARNKTVKGVSCTGCHGADPRPNWNDYATWPGAYGQKEDLLEPSAGAYREFVENRYHHPRYEWLIQPGNSWAPYRLNQLDNAFGHRPNFRLTEIFGRLNALRAARLLEEKLPRWERWAYVVSALQCILTDEQKAALGRQGIDPEKDLSLSKIFSDLGLTSYEWSTRFKPDPSKYPSRPWEFQAGFAMFSENVATAVIKNEADNPVFASAFAKILDYFAKTYGDDDKEFHQALNGITPNVDFFGQGHDENRGYLCPEAARLLLESARY
ncbi:MAG TPA: hypothetical protein VIH99_00120, partial [Bdellovibrionota bacterium]